MQYPSFSIKHIHWNFECSNAVVIDKLIKTEKEIEAIYFVHQSGLIDRFPPESLLKMHLESSKKKSNSILKDGNNSPGALVCYPNWLLRFYWFVGLKRVNNVSIELSLYFLLARVEQSGDNCFKIHNEVCGDLQPWIQVQHHWDKKASCSIGESQGQ